MTCLITTRLPLCTFTLTIPRFTVADLTLIRIAVSPYTLIARRVLRIAFTELLTRPVATHLCPLTCALITYACQRIALFTIRTRHAFTQICRRTLHAHRTPIAVSEAHIQTLAIIFRRTTRTAISVTYLFIATIYFPLLINKCRSP